MRVEVEDLPGLVSAVSDELIRRGVVMVRPERVEPYSMNEVHEMTGLSVTSITRLCEAGRIERVKGTGRVLFTAASVEAWMKGGDDE